MPLSHLLRFLPAVLQMSDFYSAIVFLSAFIMIIMVLLVRSNDLVEYSEKQTIYTISVLVIAGDASE